MTNPLILALAPLMLLYPSSSLFLTVAGQDRSIPVKFKLGSEFNTNIADGMELDMTISPNQIFFENNDGPGFRISTSEVVEITYDNSVHRRAGLWKLWYSGWPCCDYLGVGLVVGAVVSGATSAVLEFFKGTDHYVNILWRPDQTVQEVIFEVGKDDHEGVPR